MEGFTSLLIIASAFSVFGQYLDNNHLREVQAIKDRVSKLKLSGKHMRHVKKQWDEFDSRECLRARRFVYALFSFMLLMLFMVFMYSINTSATLHWAWMGWVVPACCAVLLIISISMAYRLYRMAQELTELTREAKDIDIAYRASKTAIKNHDKL